MIRSCIVFLLLCLCLGTHPVAGVAQEQDVAETVFDDAEVFERLAQRAEALAANQDASSFSISRIRAELGVWRDEFLVRSTVNTGRLATVDAQLLALGPVPENGEEASSVAARRAELVAQRTALMAPRLLAQEAHARANGLIGEFDARSLQQQTNQLTDRGPSPLNPTHITAAMAAVWGLIEVIGVDIRVGCAT